ncbi:hypothetical protein EIN_318810 [Entamoeba invadens IP1]|uniref:Lipocalin n=1 Tax=Entamoeba invadens IP1 TaxID=370355 RepID=A0A0A1TZK2_ENTIV|nr:hypothetical protein EIN_318810 [Entamoeba invadens IP1]ELP87012.1 hypothetical protein EIN_318810 [Entamoeba invadens IP1]|eukprot:XP_004253783.1 hypothetical protein EIN_318810 [Entamoeba invadens IP1]
MFLVAVLLFLGVKSRYVVSGRLDAAFYAFKEDFCYEGRTSFYIFRINEDDTVELHEGPNCATMLIHTLIETGVQVMEHIPRYVTGMEGYFKSHNCTTIDQSLPETVYFPRGCLKHKDKYVKFTTILNFLLKSYYHTEDCSGTADKTVQFYFNRCYTEPGSATIEYRPYRPD